MEPNYEYGTKEARIFELELEHDHARDWAALWKRAAKKWFSKADWWNNASDCALALMKLWQDIATERIEQRNEAARLFWRMKDDRDGWRALATEWAKSNSSLRRELVAANARIAELEAER